MFYIKKKFFLDIFFFYVFGLRTTSRANELRERDDYCLCCWTSRRSRANHTCAPVYNRYTTFIRQKKIKLDPPKMCTVKFATAVVKKKKIAYYMCVSCTCDNNSKTIYPTRSTTRHTRNVAKLQSWFFR